MGRLGPIIVFVDSNASTSFLNQLLHRLEEVDLQMQVSVNGTLTGDLRISIMAPDNQASHFMQKLGRLPRFDRSRVGVRPRPFPLIVRFSTRGRWHVCQIGFCRP
jgi:hypothetical protein